MEQYKASSARQVFFTDLKINLSFTLENSFFKKYTKQEIEIINGIQQSLKTIEQGGDSPVKKLTNGSKFNQKSTESLGTSPDTFGSAKKYSRNAYTSSKREKESSALMIKEGIVKPGTSGIVLTDQSGSTYQGRRGISKRKLNIKIQGKQSSNNESLSPVKLGKKQATSAAPPPSIQRDSIPQPEESS